MTLTDTYDDLATATEAQIVAAFHGFEAGRITRAEFVAVAAAFVAAGTNRATGLADAALAAYLSAATGQAVAALGILPPDVDHARALADLLDRDDVWDPGPRTGRYGRAQTLATAQDTYGEGLRRRGVPGWTRVLNTGACQMCRDLAGAVLPGTVPMYHHEGCGCAQRPVLTEGNPT